MTHAARLERLYAGWAPEAITPSALATARMAILDIAGCIVGGAPSATAQAVTALAREQGEGAGASVLGTQWQLAPPLAALANGTAGHVLDYDDMNSSAITHPSVVLVPALLAVAESLGRPGRDLVSAYVLGFEVVGHLGRAIVPRHYEAGWHATSTLGIFGAAAGASRLLGLDAGRALHALAIAASLSAGVRANFGTMTKALHAGQAAEGGVRAALLAARGFTGNPGVFDAPGGYLELYGAGASPRPDPAGLEIDASGIGIKPYACCGAGVALIDAALDLRAAHGIGGGEVASIEARVSRMAAGIMPFHEAADGAQAKYSLAYCAAVALLDGAGGTAQFDDARVARDDVRDLVQRTRVAADERMAQGAGRFGVELAVTLRDGRTLATALDLPRGHPQRPLERERLHAKFHECAAPVLGAARARSAIAALETIHDAGNVRDVAAALRRQD